MPQAEHFVTTPEALETVGIFVLSFLQISDGTPTCSTFLWSWQTRINLQLSEINPMRLFGSNPLDEPWSTRKKIYFVLYAIFFAASVWASGESLHRSTTLPKVFCYLVAFGVLALASLCLKLVRDSFSKGPEHARALKLLFGLLGFAIAWTAILSANTHNIYYVMTVDKQRQQELRLVKNQLELVQDKSVSAFYSAKTEFSSNIEREIGNLKAELLNPNNQGHGPKTDEIITRIEVLLGNEVDLQTNAPTERVGLRQYTTDLAEKIRIMTAGKLKVVDEKINQLNLFLNKDEYHNTQNVLDHLITNYRTVSENEIIEGLRNSYSTYSKTQEYIDQLYSEPLIRNNANLDLKKLPEVPISIESEAIAFVWGQFFRGELPRLSLFLWSLGIGFIFDFTCFMFWYFGVLPEE